MKYDEENRIISSKRTYNQTITVEQRLSLIKNNATNREDVVEIRYIITNHSPIVQNVGLRIMMDTMLGSNDAAPFRVPGTGSVTTETEFRGLRIPQIWQAFESLTNSSVVSQGTFYKDYKNKPDAVQFTNWGNVYRMDWDYTVKKGSANGDSAVSVIWDEKDILPLQKKEYVTYYGLSEFTENLKPPLALSVYSESNAESMNGVFSPIPVTAFIQNIGAAEAKNVTISIELGDGLVLNSSDKSVIEIGKLARNEEKMVDWSLSIFPSEGEDAYTYKIILKADDCESKEIVKTINVDKMKKAIIVVPGIMGSNLIDGNTDEWLWMNDSLAGGATMWKILWNKLDCDENGESKNINIVPRVGKEEYGALNIYENLLNSLRKEYGDQYSVIFAPYDWRLGLFPAASRLKQEIDKYDEVSIVAHSMGGLVVEKYLDSSSDAAKIKKVITLGTPYWGAVMAPNTLYTGEVDAFPVIVSMMMALPMKGTLNNFTGVYELLPNRHFTNARNWCTEQINKNEKSDFWDYVFSQKVETTLLDWNGTKAFYNKYFNNNCVTTALTDHDSLYPTNTQSPMDKVDVTYIVGNNEKTAQKSKYTDAYFGNHYVNTMVTEKTNEGDGTVPFLSATMNRVDAASLKGEEVEKTGQYIILNNQNHTELVVNTTGINQVVSELKAAFDISKERSMEREPFTELSNRNSQNDSLNGEEYRIDVIGELNIEVYKDNGLLYYLIMDGECNLDKLDGDSFSIDRIGTFNEQPITSITFKDTGYDFRITSRSEQTVRAIFHFGTGGLILDETSVKDKDILEFSIYEETKDTLVLLNGAALSTMRVDENGDIMMEDPEITGSDLLVQTRNPFAGIKDLNTMYPQFHITNNSEKPVKLEALSIDYYFDGDGNSKHIYEYDWAAVNNSSIKQQIKGEIIECGNGQFILHITFIKSDILINPGEVLELHTRVRTADWSDYDTWNDYSRATAEYEVQSNITISCDNVLIYGTKPEECDPPEQSE